MYLKEKINQYIIFFLLICRENLQVEVVQSTRTKN